MLSKEQKHILHEEGTEPLGSSPLNYEKRKGDYLCVGCRTKLFESKKKFESGSGWPSFFEAYPMYLKLRLIIQLVYPELSITVKSAEVIMDIFLKMDHNLLAKDIVIMVYV